MKTEYTDVKLMVSELISAGLTPQQISEEMDNRVSSRTIYRWAKGDSVPQNESDVEALGDLVGRMKGGKA